MRNLNAAIGGSIRAAILLEQMQIKYFGLMGKKCAVHL